MKRTYRILIVLNWAATILGVIVSIRRKRTLKGTNSTLTKAVLGLALACISLASCGKRTDSRGQSSNTNNLKPEDRQLRLGQFKQIHGTQYLMAEITAAQSRGSLSSSSDSGSGKTRNLVFVYGESLDLHSAAESQAGKF